MGILLATFIIELEEGVGSLLRDDNVFTFADSIPVTSVITSCMSTIPRTTKFTVTMSMVTITVTVTTVSVTTMIPVTIPMTMTMSMTDMVPMLWTTVTLVSVFIRLV